MKTTGFACAALLLGGSATGSAQRKPKYDEVHRIPTHDSYWVKRDNIVESYGSVDLSGC